MPPSHEQWAPVAAFLERTIGYAIAPAKYYLLDANLARLLTPDRPDPQALVRKAEANASLRQQLIDAATINESFFFRDVGLWSALRERVLPEMAEAVSFCNELHVLTCACSRGQEVWSLAMTLAEHPAFANIRPHITAADIDTTVLAYAQRAVYTELECSRGLDPTRRQRWFRQDGNGWSIDEQLRKQVQFQQLNLNDPFSFMRRFDLVFCRNVLIYFDVAKKPAILERLARFTNNHGYLILGGAESALNLGDSWRPRSMAGYTFYEKGY